LGAREIRGSDKTGKGQIIMMKMWDLHSPPKTKKQPPKKKTKTPPPNNKKKKKEKKPKKKQKPQPNPPSAKWKQETRKKMRGNLKFPLRLSAGSGGKIRGIFITTRPCRQKLPSSGDSLCAGGFQLGRKGYCPQGKSEKREI